MCLWKVCTWDKKVSPKILKTTTQVSYQNRNSRNRIRNSLLNFFEFKKFNESTSNLLKKNVFKIYINF